MVDMICAWCLVCSLAIRIALRSVAAAHQPRISCSLAGPLTSLSFDFTGTIDDLELILSNVFAVAVSK